MKWKCLVCGYIHEGTSPPKECPQCSSKTEFVKENLKFDYDGKKFDVLIINGSTHSRNNTGYLSSLVEDNLKKRKLSYKRINLNELKIKHCWCCYSIRDNACTYPCRNQQDDMPKLHEMLVNSKAVIVLSPINWNNMSARLKDCLDRTTCLQNLTLLKKKSLTKNKIFSVIIDGHEDGAMKTAMDIFIYFQQMGYIMAPFGFTYLTHGSQFNTETDHKNLVKDKDIKYEVKGIVNNVIEMIRLNLEKKLKTIQVSE